MGKQGRRQQRQRKKEQAATKSPTNSASAIHQLRHANPKTRHGALVALQANFLHSDNKQQISVSVLQAVREQVMDNNLECASAAAGCLAQYLSFASSRCSNSYPQQTASWTLVLMGRLDQCHANIKTAKEQGKQQLMKQWYALAAPCLRALCKLIESNELALDQINLQKQTFLMTLFALLQDAVDSASGLMEQSDTRVAEWVQETATYAARAIHSSIDDNDDMVHILNTNKNTCNAEWWSNLLKELPSDLAQLHLSGCIVALYQMAPKSWHLACLTNIVIPFLTHKLLVDGQELQTLADNYQQAKDLWESQKEDDAVEQEVIQTVQARREPARQIARRQKETPRPEPTEEQKQPSEKEDGRQATEDALVAWNGVFLPLQVALEVTANLLSCLVQKEDDMTIEKDNEALDQVLHQTLVDSKLSERLLQTLQMLCVFESNEVALKVDLVETISTCSGCLSNCALSKVLAETDFPATWQALRNHALEAGVCSVLVVLARLQDSLVDLELVLNLLAKSANEEVQRDAVCLLAATLNNSGTAVPSEVVAQMTNELVRILQQGSTIVKAEVLNVIMDLYGQDDFYPQVFSSLKLLNHFQHCIASMPKKSDINPEIEEILFNAHRFVDYKLGR